MTSIDTKLDHELCAFLKGWHDLEGDGALIDMMLSPAVEPKKYAHRFQVLKDIEHFLDCAEVKENDLVHRKMKAHKSFLLKSMGEIIPFDTYLQETMNIKPVVYDDKKLAALKGYTNSLLAQFGLFMSENVSKNLAAQDVQIKGDAMQSFFNSSHQKLFDAMSKKTGITADFRVHYKGIDEAVPMVAEIRGDGKDYNVLFNMYHMNDYGACKLNLLAAHEITSHAVQFASLRKKIEQGDLPNYLGYVTAHEPLHFSSEGLAETIQYFYADDFDNSDMMKATLALNRYKRLVSNNAAIMLNRGGSFKEAVEYVHEHAPDYPIDRMASMLSFQADKPLGSSYYQVYSQALETFLEISGSHPDKDEFIRSVYQDFLMPDDIISQTRRPIASFV